MDLISSKFGAELNKQNMYRNKLNTNPYWARSAFMCVVVHTVQFIKEPLEVSSVSLLDYSRNKVARQKLLLLFRGLTNRGTASLLELLSKYLAG